MKKHLKNLWRHASPLAVVGAVFTAVALVITALVLANSLHDVLTGPGWLTWPVAIGAALALDAVWTSGLAQLSTALKVRGSLLWLSGAMVAVGLGGSVAAVLVFGHTLLLAAPAIVGMVLLVADRASGYLTPSADVVGRIDRQRRDELDRAALARAAKTLSESEGSRKADERAVSRRKQLAEAVDAQRYAVEFQAALMAAKAGLYGDLSAAVEAHQADAAKLDALLGSGVAGELAAPPVAPAAFDPREAMTATAWKHELDQAAPVRTAPADQDAEVIRLDTTSGGITSAADVADRSGGANLRAAEPKFTDEELMAAGRRIMAKLDPPRTQNRFFAAMRAEGFKGSRDRLTAVHKAVKAELEADERADEQDAA